MGDRFATIDMGRKVEATVPLSVGELGPHITQCRLGRGLPPYAKWHLDPSNHLATIYQCYRLTGQTGQRYHSTGRTTICNVRQKGRTIRGYEENPSSKQGRNPIMDTMGNAPANWGFGALLLGRVAALCS